MEIPRIPVGAGGTARIIDLHVYHRCLWNINEAHYGAFVLLHRTAVVNGPPLAAAISLSSVETT